MKHRMFLYLRQIYVLFILLISSVTYSQYCPSSGSTAFATGIRQVTFNTINNATIIELNDYSDFTGISTTVVQNSSYNLAVNLNTGGNYTITAMAWIDWNQDNDFLDTGEEYVLGTAINTTNGSTTLSPFSITIPPGATLGTTRMRVSAKWGVNPTTCETGFDGEVEDYSIIVIAPIIEPEINILGNTIITIIDGSTTPSLTDKTDFGSVDHNSGATVKTYIIENLGTVTLNIGAVSITGLNAADFSILTNPNATVAVAGNTTFSILFNPSSINLKIATVSIINDDSDENPYDFAIQGTGIQSFFDSDGDGVLDNLDVDDDNDGILDLTEENYCKSVNGNTVNYKFLNETFSTGAGRATINTNNYTATSTYCYEDGIAGTDTAQCPGQSSWILDDAEYTVVSKITGTVASDPDNIHGDLAWYNGEDHTAGDIDGRMAVFNASFSNGVFYETTINGVLSNLPITYSFWALNIMAQSNFSPSILPDITVQFVDLSDNILATINTGPFGRCAASATDNSCAQGEWQQFTTSVNLGNVNAITVRFINNASGGHGNDLAIDDIVISQTLCDSDNDGVADLFDLDCDNDGIPDVVEAGLGNHSEGKATLTSITAWVDANGNGMHDVIEGNIVLDSDGDSVPNHLDLDSDNDTVFDVDESGAGNIADALYQNGDGDITGDGVGDGTDTDAIRETDVDSDGISEYYSDGILDIYDHFNGGTFATAYGNSNQGLGNTYYVLDSDSDGTPDYIDVSSDGVSYDISQTLYASLDANNDGVIDDTNDAEGDGIVDLFDTNDATFGSPRDLNRKLDLYFDGRNDYIEDSSFMGGWPEATQMCWIKIDPTTSGTKILMGQDNFFLRLNADLSVSAIANGNTISNGSALTTNMWIHIGATYSNSDGEFKLYINGVQNASTPISSSLASDTSKFTIGREPDTNGSYFKGYIDEGRVFNEALTTDEYQKMIYQEIENNTSVRGAVIPRDINTLPWSNVSRYYMFDIYKDDITDDLTTPTIDAGSGARMYNFKVIDYQTAPLPFVTQSSGILNSALDIPSDGVRGLDAITYDWSIVRVEHNDVTYNNNQKHLGLIINELDSGLNPIEYHVQNNSELNISWYLKLNGLIDLEGESQLVQGMDSALDITSKGAIEKDQQGTADLYTYNYWAAPVGVTSVVSNNNDYTLPDVLKDGSTPISPLSINWLTSGYDGTSGSPVSIADYWIWKYANQVSDNYPSWEHVRSTGSLQAGEGFTMKGTTNTGGVISNEQNYVFNGKPHNGDVTLTLSAGNDYLIGNPYASAIDADQFILDNISDGGGAAASNIINGALYFWEHFASSTHIIAEYQGGYATYSLIGGTAAINNDVRINNTGGLTSSKGAPERYIPVGQGFFVTADTGGTVTFKNGQRIFKTEASDPSIFIRNGSGKKDKKNNTITRNSDPDLREKISLIYDSPKGYHRQLLVGADINTTDNHDIGFDAPLVDENVEDMYWTFNSNKYVIQGVSNFDIDRILPLGVKVEQEGNATIRIDYLENISENIIIYLHDKDLDVYHNLKDSDYQVYLTIGEYLDRFEISFDIMGLLDNPEEEFTEIDTHYSNSIKSIIVINPSNKNINSVEIINILGQSVFSQNSVSNDSYTKFYVNNISPGVYLINIKTEKETIIKKVIVE